MKDLPVVSGSSVPDRATGKPGEGGTGSRAESLSPAYARDPGTATLAGGTGAGDPSLPAGLRVPGVYPAGPEDVDFGLSEEVLALWSALREVRDPEMPVSLVDLGLIHDVRREGGTAVVVMTFTAMGCPCMSFMKLDVEERLLDEPHVDAVRIDVVWDPPWRRSRMTDAARRTMKTFGVAV